MSSIAEELGNLINPKPSFDPEDDIHEETRARLVDKQLLEQEVDYSATPSKNFALKKPGNLLEEDEPMYKGKVVSRKDLQDGIETSSDEEDFDDDITDADEEEDSNMDDGDEESEDQSQEDNEEEALNDDEDEEIDSDAAMNSEDEGKYEPNLFKKKISSVSEAMKGKDTMNQISLWESLLETRIKVQKLLGLACQLPKPDAYPQFKEAGNNVSGAIASATNSLTKLGSAMFDLQSQLLDQVDDAEDSDNDEEIALEARNIFDAQVWNDKLKMRGSRLKKRRNKTLQFWYDKTLLTSGKANQSFSSFERPTVSQIEHILSDRERLIKRTQLQRSTYRVLGTPKDSGKGDTENDDHNAHLKQVDRETFDDDDFYQQILRQLIEQKTSTSVTGENMESSIEMTRNWLKLQHLKTKSKKVVEKKANKGRKVRYQVHPKLMSFMAPSDRSTWTHDSRNQLVKSVFGKSLIAKNL